MPTLPEIIPEGFCLKCQGCCRFAEEDSVWAPGLLGTEIEDLLAGALVPSQVTSQKKIRLVACQGGNNFVCPFLNLKDNQCRIYPQRPFECRLYPFLIHRKAGKAFLAVDLRCPFAKERHQTQDFQGYIQAVTRILRTPECKKILQENSQILQEYPQVTDLTEL